VAGDADPVAIRLSQGILQRGEEAAGAGQRWGHGAQFTKKLLPEFDGHWTMRRLDACKESVEAFESMWGQIQCRGCRVKVPTNYPFLGVPTGVALEHFFDERWFLPMLGIVRSQGTKHFINRIQG
jgi:hypothetical protein